MRTPSLLLLLVFVTVASGGLLSAVTRSQHRPDVLFPSACPASCSQLFRAVENNSHHSCACQCPKEAPIYLHTAGQCVEKLDECQTNIVFSSENGTSEFLPIAVLPAKNGVLLPKRRILWNDAGVFESDVGYVDCSVNSVFFDNAEHRWKSTSRKLFALLPSRNRSAVVFRGSEFEASQLVGSVVQLKLVCSGHPDDSLCLSFRVDGTSGRPPGEAKVFRWELVLAFVCFVLLILLVATFFIGFLCWRQEKKRLIGRIQMQILSDFRRQQEAHTNQFFRAEQGGSDFVPVLLPKRRLLFHAEFLEREYLENPPPMAEQFLIELRRMVDVARERIRMRRYVPILLSIPELPEESLSPVSSRPASPRSTKSVDSGRESREDSDGSNDSGSPRASRASLLPLPSSLPPPPPRPPQPSRIPAPIGSASPRTAQRNLSISGNKSVRARKGYAVFPVDPMLNKSLPRRPKRTAIPAPVAKPVN